MSGRSEEPQQRVQTEDGRQLTNLYPQWGAFEPPSASQASRLDIATPGKHR